VYDPPFDPARRADARHASLRASAFMDVRIERKSRVRGNLFSLVGIVGLLAAVVAGATVWLLLTDPVTVAESMDSGEYSPLVQSLAGSLYDAIVRLLKYL
jgi:hypothetical protein